MKQIVPFFLFLIAFAFTPNAAYAQTYKCTSPNSTCTRAEAYADCQKSLDDSRIPGNYQFICEEKPSRYIAWQAYNNTNWTPITQHLWVSECEAGSTWDEATHSCKKACSPNDPPLSGGFMSFTGSEPGYQTCHDGCEYNPDSMSYKFGVVDGIKFVSVAGWIPSGASCTVGPNDGYVPPADTDNDGISDSKDASPQNPGNSNAADDASNPKGDTKEDGHGSGNGNKSGGGGNCGNPPSSSSDEILAQIAYQTWATRCAIESTKDSSGTVKTTGGNNGGTVPIPGGVDMTETNSLLSAIKTYIKKVHDFIDSVTGEVSGLDTDKGEGASDLDHVWGSSSDEHDLDSSGFGWARSCPVLPSISIGGYSGQVDDGTLCTVMQAVGALVLLLAYFQAGLIIGRP